MCLKAFSYVDLIKPNLSETVKESHLFIGATWRSREVKAKQNEINWMPKTDKCGQHANPECFLQWQGITGKLREFTVESKAKHRFILEWFHGMESNQIVFVNIGKDKSSLNSKSLSSPLYVKIQPCCWKIVSWDENFLTHPSFAVISVFRYYGVIIWWLWVPSTLLTRPRGESVSFSLSPWWVALCLWLRVSI